MIQVQQWSKKKLIQDVSREVPRYPDPVYRPPPKLTEISIQEIPRQLSDFDPEINMDFEGNSQK